MDEREREKQFEIKDERDFETRETNEKQISVGFLRKTNENFSFICYFLLFGS